ncbi:hypothetical protein LSTR_LSTR015964 [Laodelphax striatellus]|uniref:Carboxylesterase type B domain-containing protein n=1 Tax=Laodelphax striatellus TaxID=195883 RepID=A0A482WEK4_LAOST|nr:hypothetical protein LSTR_LSTR015964 [Laodelphax striatellus]
MRDCLLTKPALDIADQYDLAFIYRNLPISAFAPTVDHHFLQAPPHVLMRGVSQRNIPWLVSFTKEEGIFPLMDWIDREPYRQVVDEEWDTLAPYLLDFYASVGEEQYSNLSQIIRKHYLKGDSSESLIGDYQHLNLLRNMVSDRLFKTGIVEAARLQARGSDAKVYLYEYSYKGEFSMARLLARDPDDPTQIGVDIPEMLQGTGHMEDFLIYINGYTTAKPTLPEDKQMKNALTWLWSSFITDGVPELVVNPENPDENVKLIDVLDDIPNEPEYRDEIRWTHISFPGQYTFGRSPFIAEKSFWRKVRTNDFPEH